MDRKKHWEDIYSTKALNEVSWYQPTPEISLELIGNNSSKNDAIIDVGGGDSFLVDHLLGQGYTNISVLDISANALERAKERLGEKAGLVKWIVANATEFEATEEYDVWHDRAAFHFLREDTEVQSYKEVLNKGLGKNGKVIIGTFSESGPLKCSGIEIKQYNENDFKSTFNGLLDLESLVNIDHSTPFKTTQNFNFAVMSKS